MSLSVIHLSDIHIKNKNDLILKRIDQLKSACTSSLPSNGTVVIVITGDIAFSGKKDQYELAKAMLDEIVNYIVEQKNSEVQVVFVPGNHDCDFDNESSVRKTLVESAKTNIIDYNYYSSVVSVQNEYISFVNSYGINMDMILPRVEIKCGGFSCLFLLGNTSWMSVLNETPGKIIIPNNLFESVSPEDYKVVFYLFHHPVNWLDPDNKKGFVDNVRMNADIVLLGHEHSRDSYEKIGSDFSVFCNHGKELQDSDSDDSAFSVINFDSTFQNYEVIDFCWNGKMYDRLKNKTINQYHKNASAKKMVFSPNEEICKYANDLGLVINHFAKENITLPDLFVWPDLNKSEIYNEKTGNVVIRVNVNEELHENSLSIIVGASGSGKTTLSKSLFLNEENIDVCCLLIDGSEFTSNVEVKIRETIEKTFTSQYLSDYLEQFRQLPKGQRSIIVDNFDLIKNSQGRRIDVLDYLCSYFGRVTILVSSSMELTSILASNSIGSLEHAIYYEILPLGNKKRKEIISKWYRLNETSSEDEIIDRIDSAINKVDIFIGNGNGYVPAAPVMVLSILQNLDGINKSYSGSKYGYLYESLILASLIKHSSGYKEAGTNEIDWGILSTIAYRTLVARRTYFSKELIERVIYDIGEKHILKIDTDDFIVRMIDARIIYIDPPESDRCRFMYPYIFYYFCGRYIAYHLDEQDVQELLEYMSARLYNETFGNIIIFVCHCANNTSIIDKVLFNAYDTLKNYEEFDFTKDNQVFNEIKDAVEAFIPKSIASTDEDVSKNKENRLVRMDEAGVNDGKVTKNEDTIDDVVTEKEKDMAAVIAALKTIEVLGEILQNYPVGIDAQKKTEMIDEMHKLGMRSIQAIINTTGYLEKDLIEYVTERESKKKRVLIKTM